MTDLHRLYQRLHGDDPADAEAAARELAASGRRVVAISACLLGEKTRWDGDDRLTPAAVDPLLADPTVAVLPLCPEILGGMGCPRPPVHFADGDGDALAAGGPARVVDDRGADRTAELAAGAARADALAAAAGATSALLKERSPSCGVRVIHGPSGVIPGRGAFTARLARRAHLPLRSEEDVVETG